MKDLFWLIFEQGINLLQSVLMVWLVFGSLKAKNNKTIVVGFIVSSLLMYVAIAVMSYVTYFEGFATFIHALTLFILTAIFLEGSVSHKIFLSLVPVNAVSIGSIFVSNLISYIVQKPIYEFLSQSTFLRLLTVIAGNFIYFLILFLIKNITKKPTLKLKESEWLLLSFNLIISIVAYIFVYYSIYSSNSLASNFYCALCASAIIIINITMYYLLANFSNRYEIQMENTLLRQKAEYQENAIVETKKQYEELQKIRHDFNNVIRIIASLNEENKKAEIDSYIQEFLEKQSVSKVMIKTGNSFVDAIINSKLSDATKSGIDVRISAVSNLESEHNIDLCSLLGNLLDNAIRASAESSKKIIRLDIRRENTSVVITVKNTIDESVFAKNPDLVSDKTDKKNHGYGTRIIREIAEKHSGFADFYEEDGYFCCNVILYM